MKFLVLVFLSLFVISAPKKNLDIIDSLSMKAFNDLVKDKNSNFIPVLEEGPNYFYQLLISKIYENDLDVSNDTLYLNINKCKPEYLLINDLVQREIIFSITDISSLKNYQYSFLDTVSIDDINYIEDSNKEFAKAKIPKKKESFFKKYLEPIIITTSGLITIILLLSVRSS